MRPICALLTILLAACGGKHAPLDEDAGIDGDGEPSDADHDDVTDGDPPVDADIAADGDIDADPDVPSACAEIVAESHSCLTVGPDGLYLLGLESGMQCLLAEAELPRLHEVSLARAGEQVYLCGRDDEAGETHLYGVDLDEGSVAELDTGHGCDAVAAYDGGLLVMPSHADADYLDRLYYYPTLADAATGAARILTVDYYALRMTAAGDRLYTSWFSTSEVDLFALPSGSPLGTIPLEGYDDWIGDLSVTEDGLLVVSNNHDRDGGVVVFDVESGARLWQLGTTPHGIACQPNP